MNRGQYLTLGRLLACAMYFAGCGPTLSAGAQSDPGFTLSARAADLPAYFPAYLANGYISTFSTARGTEGSMTHLVALMDYKADDFSRPAAVPGWTEIDYSTGRSVTGQQWLNRVIMGEERFRDYHQTLDLHGAILTTRYRYIDGPKQTDVEATTLVSQAEQHIGATSLAITPDFDGTVQLSFAFNLWAPHAPRLPLGRLTGPEMEEAVAANGLALRPVAPATADRAPVWYPGDVHVSTADGDPGTLSLWLDGQVEGGLAMAAAAAVELPPGLVAQSVSLRRTGYRLALDVSVSVVKGRTYRFTKYVAFSRAGWGGDSTADLALARAARSEGFAELRRRHEGAWARLWQTDILIDGDPLAQRAVHSELYYLLASSTADTAWPLGPCGLTTGYAGHVFWDSDTWVFPALLLTHPERAKSLVAFRARTLTEAQERARQHGFAGAMFPWESDPDRGTEQTPHFAGVLGDTEIHVDADIAIAQWQYYQATRDKDWLRRQGWPVIRDVARFWASRATYVAAHHRHEILHVTSVDEPFSDIPNDTYTNAAAAKALSLAAAAAAVVGEAPDPSWTRIARDLYVPISADGQHHLEFDPAVVTPDGAAGGGVPLFLLFPSLDLRMSPELRLQDYLDARLGEPATAAVGNSMGFAPSSIAAAVAGRSEDAAVWFQRNFDSGTIKGPFNVRTETAGNNTGYFLTASGAFVQNLLYGFTGLRIEEQGLAQAYPPVLPRQWQSLTLRNLTFRGERLTLRVARDAQGAVRLTREAGDPVSPDAQQFTVQEGLNRNEFLRDGPVAAHLLLRSGRDPRALVAFPAGNSGVGVWFSRLSKPAQWQPVSRPVAIVQADGSGRPLYGLTAEEEIATPSLRIDRAVLSSIRVIRDFQDLGKVPDDVDTAPAVGNRTVRWARDRVDGAAGYLLSLEVLDGSVTRDSQHGTTLEAGADGRIRLRITAASGETPMTPLADDTLINDKAAKDPAARQALTFLSYREKFLAGSWRFNTYFGRDTLMSVRLLMPALTADAVEAGLGAVLQRLSSAGEVAHEEDVGEFAVLDHLRTDGSRSSAPVLDYKMIDGTYLLAPVAQAWLLDDPRSRTRAAAFLASDDGRNSTSAVRRGQDLVANLRLVVAGAAAFAADPRWQNLLNLKAGITVGNWRDSGDGLGGGRYPYDVNAVLVPAALEAAERFLASGLLDPYLAKEDRAILGRAGAMARIWRDRAPPLFNVHVPHPVATTAIGTYAAAAGVPAQAALDALGGGDVNFAALSINAAGVPVRILNSDPGFFLLFGHPDANTIGQQVAQLMRPFPAGLMTDVGMLVANPVFTAPEVQAKFSRNAYHGAVVWSWQQALFAAGLERQLARGDLPAAVRARLREVQTRLWRAIEATRAMNNSELWSWSFIDGHYAVAPFGNSGADVDESNAAQLWSTVYLAVRAPAAVR